ncbi:MAG: DUF177 domain-containing protein [Acidobacteria bacterium]|nr:DUF177 domain-containing protein [Acidobacteriota bacterium]
MRIELDKLEDKGGSFAHTYQPDELMLDEEGVRLVKAPEVTGRVKRDHHQVRLRGKIRAEAEVDCDRCLAAIAVPVETEFDVTYVPATDYEAESAAELQAEDLTLSIFDGETIDIDELTREQVLLALPMHALCREDCKGLCPVCSINKNTDACQCETKEIDPRWSALKDLQF